MSGRFRDNIILGNRKIEESRQKRDIMDLIISMGIAFAALIYGVYSGIFIGYILIACLFLFAVAAWRRGFTIHKIAGMAYGGGKKALIVLRIFLLIGAITAAWMASGTVPGIVYYGIKFMNPNYFILYAFLISSIVSFLLGTSLGTISTVGISFMMMAKGGGVNTAAAAGALIAGAYFGDRCSPMSSSAHLVANLTESDLYINIKNMFKSAGIPLLLAVIFFGILSFQQPLDFSGSYIDQEIYRIFAIHWSVLLPALIILILAAFRVDVKKSMFISIITAAVLGMMLQSYSMREVLQYILFGFRLSEESALQGIIKGGGVLSMWKPSLVVAVSCALAGIFEGTEMLQYIEKFLLKTKTQHMLFFYTILVSMATGAFGCSQSISIVLTNQLMKNSYREKGLDRHRLALDIENTSVVLSPLIPWNIAALVPTTTMGVSSTAYLPFASYLYLIPIWNLLCYWISERKCQPAAKTGEM